MALPEFSSQAQRHQAVTRRPAFSARQNVGEP
jgi:hypothetical protein